MKKHNHFVYYFSLVALILLGFLLTVGLSPNKIAQMAAIIGVAAAYVVIGVIHHRLEHDLVRTIVVEYVLIAALGIAAALFIFRGGFGI